MHNNNNLTPFVDELPKVTDVPAGDKTRPPSISVVGPQTPINWQPVPERPPPRTLPPPAPQSDTFMKGKHTTIIAQLILTCIVKASWVFTFKFRLKPDLVHFEVLQMYIVVFFFFQMWAVGRDWILGHVGITGWCGTTTRRPTRAHSSGMVVAKATATASRQKTFVKTLVCRHNTPSQWSTGLQQIHIKLCRLCNHALCRYIFTLVHVFYENSKESYNDCRSDCPLGQHYFKYCSLD